MRARARLSACGCVTRVRLRSGTPSPRPPCPHSQDDEEPKKPLETPQDVPKVSYLTHNFRCLRGVLQLGNSVQDLLESHFPNYCESGERPAKDFGVDDGPRPTMCYHSLDFIYRHFVAVHEKSLRVSEGEAGQVGF